VASLRTSPFGVSIQRGKKRKSGFQFGVTEESNLCRTGLVRGRDSSAANADRDRQQPCVVISYLFRVASESRETRKQLLPRTPHNVRTVERLLIAVNRESYVVRAENCDRYVLNSERCMNVGQWYRWIDTFRPMNFNFQRTDTVQRIDGLPSPDKD
jgi:hypothetical protein